MTRTDFNTYYDYDEYNNKLGVAVSLNNDFYTHLTFNRTGTESEELFFSRVNGLVNSRIDELMKIIQNLDSIS